MEFLTSIVGAIAGEIGKSVIEPVKRQIRYLIFYGRNIRKLEEENQKLEDKKVEAKKFIDDAERKFREAVPRLSHWHDGAEKLNQEVCQFLEIKIGGSNKCWNGRCHTPWSRYYLSRKAFKKTQDVNQKLGEAPSFGELAYDLPTTHIGSTFNLSSFNDFGSRLSVLDQILKALRDDKLSLISICGMGGVGKTTMAKKIVEIVETAKLFDLVAMTTVSQNCDLRKVQDEIIDQLGLKIDDRTLPGRALKLHEELMNRGKKILLILDDVWEVMDFEAVGLPSAAGESKGCKIVLTSRKEDECNKMGSQKNFPVSVLSDGEAWDLFRQLALAGRSIDDQDLFQTGRLIADECRGLPIAIVTVAKALKNKAKSIWDDSLQQLKKSNLEGVPGMEKYVYSGIKLSYDLLERNEAKSCFLLCCLFPEDYSVPLEYLVSFGMGLRLFRNIDNLQQARDRVCSLIDELKGSFLLLDDCENENESVKMHDVVRDVALSIASKDGHYYLVSCGEEMHWTQTKSYKDYRAISFFYDKIMENVVDLECPKLELLQYVAKNEYRESSQSLSRNFFRGMMELKVLVLKEISFHPKSISVLKKLRTLYFDTTWTHGTINLDVLGDLANLEILAITGISLELPKEMGLLGNLRLLDLRKVTYLQYFPSGLLSKLSRLEELYVNFDFKKWELSVDNGDRDDDDIGSDDEYDDRDNDDVDDTDSNGEDKDDRRSIVEGEHDDGERINASLRELESLPITRLHVSVPTPSLLPKHTLLANLRRFNILIGNYMYRKSHKDTVNCLLINCRDASDLMVSNELSALLRKTEELALEFLYTLKNVNYGLENDGFPQLRKLSISFCEELEYLVDINRISRSHDIKLPSFSNLRKVKIFACHQFKYAFPLSMAIRLSQIQSICIDWCSAIEGIFYGEEADDEIELPNLINLELKSLEKLIGLWVGIHNTGAKLLPIRSNDDDAAMNPSITCCKNVSGSNSMEQPSTSQIAHQSSILNSSRVETEMIFVLFPSPWMRFPNLQQLELTKCDQLEVAFLPLVAEQMVQLKTLKVSKCVRMKYIIGSGGRQEPKHRRSVFPKLTSIILSDLQQLVAFCADANNVFLDCQSLKEVDMDCCPKIKASILFGAIDEEESPSALIKKIADGHNEVTNVKPSTMKEAFTRRGRKQHKSNLGDSNSSSPPGDNYISQNQPLVCSKDIFFRMSPELTGSVDLQSLKIRNCDNLIYLFSHQVAKLMVKLEDIDIILCEKIEEIVAREYGEAPESTMDKLIFPQLRFIKLDLVYNLRSFYGGMYAMELPLLESLEIDGCIHMKTFSLGSLISTPKLEEIHVNESKFSLMEDLNATMKKVMPKTLKICSVRNVTRLEHLMTIRHEDLREVQTLHIQYCDKLLNAIPCNLIASFQNLEILRVHWCESLEEIFEYEGMNIEGGSVLTFSNLEEIHLSCLRNLKSIFNKIPSKIVGFQNLRELHFRSCDSLRNVFSVSVAKSLLQLQLLTLDRCFELKEIVAREDKEEKEVSGSTHQFVFPQLRRIKIIYCSELECFYSGIYALELPLFESLEWCGQHHKETFSKRSLSTCKLFSNGLLSSCKL